jgi:hypothetical protein
VLRCTGGDRSGSLAAAADLFPVSVLHPKAAAIAAGAAAKGHKQTLIGGPEGWLWAKKLPTG